MSTTSSTEIQQLKEFIKDGFNNLDKKIDKVQAELKEDLNQVKFELKEDINQVEKRVIKIESNLEGMDKRLSNVESAIQKIPEISEKFGELRNWRQIAFIIIAAVVGWFARSGRL